MDSALFVILGLFAQSSQSSPDMSLPTQAVDDDNFGETLIALGDVDGDEYDDFVVGAPKAHARSGGNIFVISGKTLKPIHVLRDSEGRRIQLERHVSDRDGDGVADFFVREMRGKSDWCLRLYSGKSVAVIREYEQSEPGELARTFSAPESWQPYAPVVSVGDLNGDGVADYVTSWRKDVERSTSIQNSMVVGYSGADGSELFRKTMDHSTLYFGETIVGVGDLDSDGVSDLLSGAPRRVPDADLTLGNAFVLSGKTRSELYALQVPDCDFQFLLPLADIDRDGVSDFAIGGDNMTVSDRERDCPGAVHIFSGKTGRLICKLEGSFNDQHFASSIEFLRAHPDESAKRGPVVLVASGSLSDRNSRYGVQGFSVPDGRLLWTMTCTDGVVQVKQ